MKNENFVLQSSLEGNYLNVRLQEPVRLDEIVVRVVKQDCPEFLIPFRIVNINDSLSLKYKLLNTIALEYSNMTLRKAEFVRLFRNLIEPFVKGSDWFLDYHYFCIDPKYVFLDKQTDEVHYIYIPEGSYRNSDEEILGFFHDTFIRMTITDDANFQVRLFQYFSRRDVTLSDLYQLIQEEAKKLGGGVSSAPSASAPVQPASAASTDSKAKPAEQAAPAKSAGGLFGSLDKGKKEKTSEDTDEVMQALFGDKKKAKDKGKAKGGVQQTGSQPAPEQSAYGQTAYGQTVQEQKEKKSGGFSLFGKKKEQGASETSAPFSQAKEPQNGSSGGSGDGLGGGLSAPSAGASSGFFGGAAYSPVGGEGDKTEIISDSFRMAAYLELMDSPIPGAIPRIGLDFDGAYITVGRTSSDEVQPDVAFGRDFTRIGRRHARIERKGGEYYVVDLGSANHTLLNGQVLVPNQPYLLTDGGELTFTDSKPVRYRIHL